MTRERANEIERKVIYRNVGFFTALNLSPEKMFDVGRLFEKLHQDLKTELNKEVVEEGKQLAVNHGKWIEREVPSSDDDVDIMYKCSCCGNEDGLNYKSMKYCPNCGVQMDEEGGENG